MAIHSGTVWPAARILVPFLLYAIVHATATLSLDVQEITTSHVELLRGLALNYKEESHNRDARESSDCNTTESRTINCNSDCQCVDGKWQCCRLRKEINMMTKAEVKRFTDAYLKIANDPLYSPAFTSLSWSHAVVTCAVFMGQPGWTYSLTPKLFASFVSWHHMMLYALENLLRLVDCGVTVPYWDPTTQSNSIFIETIPDGFGTLGLAKNNYCVTDGPFRKGALTMPELKYKGTPVPSPKCLKRDGMKSHMLPYQLFQTMLTAKPEFGILFESIIFPAYDDVFHAAMGGSFVGASPAVDPLLYLLHNFGNKIIANYQMQGPSHLTAGGRWDNDIRLTAFPWFKSTDFLDPFNLPNGVCVRWGASMPRDEAIQMGYYAGLETPRKDHISLPYKEVRELPIDPIDAHTFSVFLKELKAPGFMPSFNLSEAGPTYNGIPRSLKPHNFTRNTAQCVQLMKSYPGFLSYNVSMSLAELL